MDRRVVFSISLLVLISIFIAIRLDFGNVHYAFLGYEVEIEHPRLASRYNSEGLYLVICTLIIITLPLPFKQLLVYAGSTMIATFITPALVIKESILSFI